MNEYKIPEELQVSFQTQAEIIELISKKMDKWTVKKLLKFMKVKDQLSWKNFALLYQLYPDLKGKKFSIGMKDHKRIVEMDGENEN